MKIAGGDQTKTRERLLTAAGEIFAEKGFRDTTVAEICRKAGTNIAAVNYHFGSKEVLYREAWRHAFHESIEAHPPEGGVPETAPPEERLQAQVSALVRRMTDRNNRAYSFLYREYANPTDLLALIRKEIKPIQQRTRRLLRELLGPSVGEKEILFCEMAIIGQCTNPMLVHGRLEQLNGGKEALRIIDDIDAYARHIVEFSLAGLAAVRRKAEARRLQGEDKMPGKAAKGKELTLNSITIT
jgi:AcrR family transcriptional regulator